MNPLLAALALAAAATGAAAADRDAVGDPLHSQQCESARAQLEQLLDDPRTRRGPRLAQARRRAADACLGRAGGTPQRSGAPERPQSVPPPTLVTPRPAPAITIAPSAPLAIPRPTVITTCDAAGCWDSEGRRLNQTGPFLVGPGGVCNVQGSLVRCP